MKSIIIPTCLPLLLLITIELVQAQAGYNEPCSRPFSGAIKPSGAEDSMSTAGPIPEFCDYHRGFMCRQYNEKQVCRCYHEEHMVYDPLRDACFPIIGANCSVGFGERIFLECLDPHSDCIWPERNAPRCECRLGFLPEEQGFSRDNRCLPLPGDGDGNSCNASLPCHPESGSQCSSGSCECLHPLSQTPQLVDYRHKLLKCLNIPEFGECGNSFDCVANSECGSDNICHCKPSHTPTSKPSSPTVVACSAEYEGYCGGIWNGHNYDYSECNENSGLRCIAGKCACRYEPDAIFDPVLRECAATQGKPCRLSGEHSGTGLPPCQSGLSCIPSEPWGKEGRGICVQEN